jgi:DNA-binding response OmpR family regulator
MDETTTPGPGCLLVTAGDPQLAEAVAATLRAEGVRVVTTPIPRRALAAVVRFEPDLVVLEDLALEPRGADLARRLSARGFQTAFIPARHAPGRAA